MPRCAPWPSDCFTACWLAVTGVGYTVAMIVALCLIKDPRRWALLIAGLWILAIALSAFLMLGVYLCVARLCCRAPHPAGGAAAATPPEPAVVLDGGCALDESDGPASGRRGA